VFEFNQERVKRLRSLVEVALPYLARLHADEKRATLSGIAMHELRSRMLSVRNRLGSIKRAASPDARQQVLADAGLILKAGHALSDLFLNWTGFEEQHLTSAAATDPSFWRTVDEYGQMCARGQPSLQWQGWPHNVPALQLKELLQRVLYVLIDNAFRHADRKQPNKQVSLAVEPLAAGHQHLVLCIRNPGEVSSRVDFLNFDTTPRQHVGLTLTRKACDMARATLQFSNDAKTSKTVLATLSWPLATTTSQ
jgi:signal transduction histidine kinase